MMGHAKNLKIRMAGRGKFKIEWIDAGREPKCAPNPEFPNGIALDVSNGAQKTCVTSLPYPAKRCGTYIVECETCGLRVGCTTAGRVDDPNSIKVACKASDW